MADCVSQRRPGPCGYDAELRRHDEVLRRACGIQSRDHVLDIGCGTGETTRQAARTAAAGSALGVDVSAPAIERARELARAEGLRNVAFERADAQVHGFPQQRFDLAISRFGTMFFDDPAAAFANIGRALRPAGRLVMMVWQAGERNEWDVAIRRSVGAAPPGRRRLHRCPRAGLLRPGRGRRPRPGPRLQLHQQSAERARSRRRGAGGRTSAPGARRAPGRRRCLVRLPSLDRHGASRNVSLPRGQGV
jgi:SAM-dependent methyltransferase